jgi:hypothetical protein
MKKIPTSAKKKLTPSREFVIAYHLFRNYEIPEYFISQEQKDFWLGYAEAYLRPSTKIYLEQFQVQEGQVTQ